MTDLIKNFGLKLLTKRGAKTCKVKKKIVIITIGLTLATLYIVDIILIYKKSVEADYNSNYNIILIILDY